MPSREDPTLADERPMVEAFLDHHRADAAALLEGLSEAQARERLVASDTTLLGLVKHLTFVEKVWFVEAVSGTPRTELGLPSAAPESFLLDPADSVESIRNGYLTACAASRTAISSLSLDDVVTGNWRGPMSLRWIMLHCIRETAQHVGHGEILREQLLA